MDNDANAAEVWVKAAPLLFDFFGLPEEMRSELESDDFRVRAGVYAILCERLAEHLENGGDFPSPAAAPASGTGG